MLFDEALIWPIHGMAAVKCFTHSTAQSLKRQKSWRHGDQLVDNAPIAAKLALKLLIDDAAAGGSNGVVRRLVRRGQILMHEGDDSLSAWYVADGRLRVFRVSADGAMVALAERGSSDVIGELSLIDGETRCASVIALEDSEVVSVPKALFHLWLRTETGFAAVLVYQLARQLRESSEKTFAVAAAPIAARLATELFRLASRNSDDLLHITALPSVTELAVRIHATRESVSKTLSRWLDAKWVERDARSLTIADAAALSELLV